MELLMLGLVALNFVALLYVVFRLPFAVSFPFAMALAQKEAELIVLRQTLLEARKTFAMMASQRAEAASEDPRKGVAKPE